jgi:hypothetical protein
MVKILSPDTVGTSTPEVISHLFSNLIPKYPEIEFGAHLHTTPDKWFEKLMQHIKPVVADLMVLFKVLADAQWRQII